MKHLVARILFLLTLLVTACARTSDDAAIRAAVAAMGDAVEHKEPKRLLSHLATDFAGHDGLDREGVRRLMAYHFLRNSNLHVMLLDVRIQLRGDEAQVRLRAALAGGNELLPDKAQAYDVASEWQRSEGEWLMRRATWAPVFDGR